jgi:tetratricopeptide (TPR) repeat protein
MSDTSTSSDDLEALLYGAESAVIGAQNDRAWELATQVRSDAAATPEQQGRAALVLSKAALAMGSSELASHHLADAQALGVPVEDLAAVRGDIRRMEPGLTAAADGVQGAEETTAVIAAAREAIDNGQHVQAEELLVGIWETTQADESQLPEASYQMGRALLGQHRLTEAKEYADWAAGRSHPRAAGLQKDIAEMQDAEAKMADGVQVAEQKPLFDLAQEAYLRGDYAGALELYQAVSDSPTLTPTQRGSVAFNVGQCHRYLGNTELARAWYEEHLRVNPTSPYADEVREKMGRMEELAHLTEPLPI